MSYEEVLKDFLMVEDDSFERISKAKLIGLIVLVIYVLGGIWSGRSFLPNLFFFSTYILMTYLVGLFYYFIIRFAGYILRNVLSVKI